MLAPYEYTALVLQISYEEDPQSFHHFLQVKTWLSEDDSNVVAVHCKGGKGRTGTMICVLLVEFGLFDDAAGSLEYFGQRRTDRNVSRRFQGVETASQIRYVTYFERLRLEGREYPGDVWVSLQEINITGLQ